MLLPGVFVDNRFLFNDASYKFYEQKLLSPLLVKGISKPIAKIRILNGSGQSGLARRMRNRMFKDRINVVEFSTSTYPLMHSSIAICQKGDSRLMDYVKNVTGIKKVYYIVDSSLMNNVLIILGKDKRK